MREHLSPERKKVIDEKFKESMRMLSEEIILHLLSKEAIKIDLEDNISLVDSSEPSNISLMNLALTLRDINKPPREKVQAILAFMKDYAALTDEIEGLRRRRDYLE